MDYDWDKQKRLKNLIKHKVDFALIEDFDWDAAIGYPDHRQNYGETRIVAFGKIAGRLHICVYTQRETGRRIISLRKANKREEKIYGKITQTID